MRREPVEVCKRREGRRGRKEKRNLEGKEASTRGQENKRKNTRISPQGLPTAYA
jgi:hypothetical protein